MAVVMAEVGDEVLELEVRCYPVIQAAPALASSSHRVGGAGPRYVLCAWWRARFCAWYLRHTFSQDPPDIFLNFCLPGSFYLHFPVALYHTHRILPLDRRSG